MRGGGWQLPSDAGSQRRVTDDHLLHFRRHRPGNKGLAAPWPVRTLARTYADQYKKVNGPKQPLVRQWIDYLEKSKP